MTKTLLCVNILFCSVLLGGSHPKGSDDSYFEGVLSYKFTENSMSKPASEVVYYLQYPFIKRVYTSPINNLEIVTLIDVSDKKSYQIFKGLIIAEKRLDDHEEKSKISKYLDDTHIKLEDKNGDIHISSLNGSVDIMISENTDFFFQGFYIQFIFSNLHQIYFDDIQYIPERLYYKFGDYVCEYLLIEVVRKELDAKIFEVPHKRAVKGWENRSQNSADE